MERTRSPSSELGEAFQTPLRHIVPYLRPSVASQSKKLRRKTGRYLEPRSTTRLLSRQPWQDFASSLPQLTTKSLYKFDRRDNFSRLVSTSPVEIVIATSRASPGEPGAKKSLSPGSNLILCLFHSGRKRRDDGKKGWLKGGNGRNREREGGGETEDRRENDNRGNAK